MPSMRNRIFTTSDARRLARRRLPRLIFDFVDGGAGEERASSLNVECLESIRLLPRTLVNVNERRLGKRLFGRDWALPFGIAPMGMCNLTWPHADAMLARAAKNHGIPLVLSTMASSSIETTAERAAGQAWFQLYVGESDEAAFELVERAAAAHYDNLILTVDLPVIGTRPRELRSGFSTTVRLGPAQFLDLALHPRWSLATLRHGVPRLANVNLPGAPRLRRDEARGGVDRDFLARLRERWSGNLIVKGVLSAEDAVLIRDAGADAVWVSNHGGRQFDGAPAAIQVLGRIRDAVGEDFPLIFDSGIRSGEGVIKALVLGADFVFVGRPFLYAIGAGGDAGLRRMIELIRDQIDNGLAQLGCPDIDDLDRGYLFPTHREAGSG